MKATTGASRVPEKPNPAGVLMVVPDLLFATRIQEVARQTGIGVAPTTVGLASEACTAPPRLVVVDLEAPGVVPDLLHQLKGDPRTASIPILAFYPHVARDLGSRALEAGADQVLPRSAFVRRLPDLLAAATESGSAP